MKEKERQSREEKELELCTFSPVTIDCPSYVKRIAMSMAAVKAAAAGQNKGTSMSVDQILWNTFRFFDLLYFTSVIFSIGIAS